MSELRTVTRTITGDGEARRYARALVAKSKWFEMTPLPNAKYEFRMKDEDGIPEVSSRTTLAREAKYRKAADDIWGKDGEIEVDQDALISESEDGGAYVQAWVWVDAENAGIRLRRRAS